ncbi:hypothetical protein D3C73_1245370 [compost metagenome]
MPAVIDGTTRSLEPGYAIFDAAQRMLCIAGGILDRQAGHAGVDRHRHTLVHRLRAAAETIFEVGVHRQIGRRHHHPQMGEDLIATHRPVRLPVGPGMAGAGGGQCLRTQPRQRDGTANIPWVGQQEATGCMKCPEGSPAVLDRVDTHHGLLAVGAV